MSHIPSPTVYGILRNYYFFPLTLRLIQDRDQSIKTQYSVSYVPTKLIEGFSKTRHLLALTETVMHDVIKPAMVYLSTKTTMRKLPVALSPGNVLPTNSSPSQSLPVTSQNKLKIYQWNADGIRPKLLEVRDWQINSDIDVLAVHESKLRKTDKTPFIVGYATIRKVRNNILGGDLLLFIRTDIVFEKLHSLKKAGMETLSIRLKATKSTCLNSTIYIYQTPQLNIIHSTPF